MESLTIYTVIEHGQINGYDVLAPLQLFQRILCEWTILIIE